MTAKLGVTLSPMPGTPSILEQLRSASLSAAERRIADVIVAEPEIVAFETVAQVAKRSGTGGASVMRLAVKLGFDGFSQLQEAVRDEVMRTIRPAATRARLATSDDPISKALDVELSNVQRTLSAIDGELLNIAASLLADARRIAIVSGDAGSGIAAMFAADLGMVRPDVEHVTAPTVGLIRQLVHLDRSDVVVVIDVARYDRAVVDTLDRLAGMENRPHIIALSDSHFSPIAKHAIASFAVWVNGTGPFDSYAGVLSLVNVIVTATMARSGTDEVVARLDRLESIWTKAEALTEGD